MSFETYLTFIFAIQVVALTPGPVWFHLLGNISQQNNSTTYYIVLGNALGLITHISFAYLGLSLLIASSATAYSIIKILGGGYLLYLAYKAFTRKSTPLSSKVKNANTTKAPHKIILEAYGINLLNPKVITFLIAFFPQFINTSAGDVGQQYLIFGATYVLNASIFLILLAKFAFKIQNKTSNNTIWQNSLRYLSGSVLGYFGLKIIGNAFTSYKRS